MRQWRWAFRVLRLCPWQTRQQPMAPAGCGHWESAPPAPPLLQPCCGAQSLVRAVAKLSQAWPKLSHPCCVLCVPHCCAVLRAAAARGGPWWTCDRTLRKGGGRLPRDGPFAKCNRLDETMQNETMQNETMQT
eukprot:scaffold39_cov66-Phaeocystis_antarctica.AAC.3